MIAPIYSHADIDLYTGDSLAVLRELPDASVQCCVTSPPFFGLRDYGTATWEGGDAACGHLAPSQPRRDSHGGFQPGSQRGTQPNTQATVMQYRGACARCGARRIDQQIGLEATPAAYIAALVAVFREVRRILKADGLLFCEIGDSYAGAGYSNHANTGGAQRADGGKQRHTNGTGYKPKDLMLMPFELAKALRDDGWYLRAPIIWHKPAAMPESVRDRVTIAHSYVWMLAKSDRYFYDASGCAEPSIHSGRIVKATGPAAKNGSGATDVNDRRTAAGFTQHDTLVSATRNARSVWSITHEGFDGGHYATMPRELARRCILAGSAPGYTVLDPFSGAGTTALVAKTLGRKAIGIELNPAYVELSRKRVEEPLFEAAAEPPDEVKEFQAQLRLERLMDEATS